MPTLGKSEIERLTLPSTKGSDDEGWVKIRLNPDAGDVMAYLSDSDKDSYGDNVFRLLANNIIKWNMQNENGEVAEINVANVRRLTMIDLNYLLENIKLDEAFAGINKEKKRE